MRVVLKVLFNRRLNSILYFSISKIEKICKFLCSFIVLLFYWLRLFAKYIETVSLEGLNFWTWSTCYWLIEKSRGRRDICGKVSTHGHSWHSHTHSTHHWVHVCGKLVTHTRHTHSHSRHPHSHTRHALHSWHPSHILLCSIRPSHVAHKLVRVLLLILVVLSHFLHIFHNLVKL